MQTSMRKRELVGAVVLACAIGVVSAGRADAASFGASWQLNEKTGKVIDSSGNHNDGVIHGGVTRDGTGYTFDGHSGYVSVANSASLNPGVADITITISFTLDGNPASGDDYDLLRKGLAGTKGGDFKVEILPGGKAFCRFRGSNVATVSGGSNLGTGTHTIQCIKTASKVSLSVDGSIKASKSVKVGSISNTQPVMLGAKPGDDFTKGFVDFITIS